jgi:DNA gyrase subunit A
LTDRDHEVEVIAAGTGYLLRSREERADLLDGLLKALNQNEAVQALIRASESAAVAQPRLMDLLDINQVQASAVLDMQWRKLAVADRRALADEYQRLTAEIAEYELILGSPDKQRDLVGTERGEFLAKYADLGGPDS